MDSIFILLGALLILISGAQCRTKETREREAIAENWSVIDENEFLDSDGEVMIQRNVAEQTVLEKRNNCRCKCRRKYGGDTWHCCKCTWTSSICFPGISTVQLVSGDVIKMADLRPGQEIMTAYEGKRVKTKVVTFMKRNPEEVGIYMKIETAGGHTLALSPSHVIFTSKVNETNTMIPRFSEKVDIGDYVFVHKNGPGLEQKLVPDQVIAVSQLAMEGVYVPLTEHGTLLVDDIYTSCYASFDHHLAHIFMWPIRRLPWLFAPSPEATGMATYVHYVKTFGRWVLPYGLQDKPTEAHENVRISKVNRCKSLPVTFLFGKFQKSIMTCSGII